MADKFINGVKVKEMVIDGVKVLVKETEHKTTTSTNEALSKAYEKQNPQKTQGYTQEQLEAMKKLIDEGKASPALMAEYGYEMMKQLANKENKGDR